MAGLISAASAFLYIAFPTRNYVFEGLARAMPIELGRFSALFNGNYLLYGAVGALFHFLAQSLGYSGLAVNSLQVMDGFFGAAGLFVFFLTLRRLGADRYSAAIWSGILGASFAYWRWSTDAEDYIFSAFLLQLNFWYLVSREKGKASGIVAGLLHGLAIMGHIVNVVFAPVVIWFLVAHKKESWQRPVVEYFLSVIGVTTAAYAAVLGLIVRPHQLADAWRWFLGSAASPEGAVGWHGASRIQNIWPWLQITVHIFTSFQPKFHAPTAWAGASVGLWIARGVLALFLAIFAVMASRVLKQQRTVAIGCLLWFAAYAIVFTSWEPYTMVYRVSDLVPLCTLLFLGYKATLDRKGSLREIASLLLIALAVGNFSAEIYPSSFASNNSDLERMLFIKANTESDAWVTGEGGRDELYIPYFAERRPLLIGRYHSDPAGLTNRINSMLAEQQKIYTTERVMADAQWAEFFGQFKPEIAARSDGVTLYRIASKSTKKSP